MEFLFVWISVFILVSAGGIIAFGLVKLVDLNIYLDRKINKTLSGIITSILMLLFLTTTFSCVIYLLILGSK